MSDITVTNVSAMTVTANLDAKLTGDSGLGQKVKSTSNDSSSMKSNSNFPEKTVTPLPVITPQPASINLHSSQQLVEGRSVRPEVDKSTNAIDKSEMANDSMGLIASVKTLLSKSWVNIFQCGPQLQVKGIDLKCTPTFVCIPGENCLPEKTFCFLCHPEIGTSIPSGIPGAKMYVLAIHNQCGLGVTLNSSFNPKNWSFYGIIEKLEHIEITLPLNEFHFEPFSASAQSLFAIECGKTTEIKDEYLKTIVKQVFCEIPTAIGKAIYQNVKNKLQPVITEQPMSLQQNYSSKTYNPENPQTEVSDTILETSQKSIAMAAIKTVHEASQSKKPDEEFWFGITIGPYDINSSKKWGGSDIASASFQVNNYFRVNFMFKYKSGKFILPDNITQLCTILHKMLGSPSDVKRYFTEICSTIKSRANDNKDIESVSKNLEDEIINVIDLVTVNNIELPDYVPIGSVEKIKQSYE
jgi:hypothetical protein